MSFCLLRCKALGFGQCNIKKSGELKWLVSTRSLKTGKNNAGARRQPIEKADARHKRDLFGECAMWLPNAESGTRHQTHHRSQRRQHRDEVNGCGEAGTRRYPPCEEDLICGPDCDQEKYVLTEYKP